MDRPNSETGGTVVVFAGGDSVAGISEGDVPSDAFVIAADSGLDVAYSIGVEVDLAVGDFDSVSADGLSAAQAGGTVVERHPEDKDATDLELALGSAVARSPDRILIFGGSGGRFDHLLGNTLLIASPLLGDTPVLWTFGATTVVPARPRVPAVIKGATGDLVSLLPVAGTATGVSTEGLRWPLDGASLHPGSTRGISNVMTDSVANVAVATGVVLTIHERNKP